MGRGLRVTEANRPDETLTAALIQISGHAERLAALDERCQRLADTLGTVADRSAIAAARADGCTGSQAAVLVSVENLQRQVASLAARLSAHPEEADEDGSYQPAPTPRWWKLSGPERDAALDRLRAWVAQVYCPCYGRLAALLPPCWEDHPLCLAALDWLSELWSVLYLAVERGPEILAAQAEWQTRLLPAAADQMAADADGCPHAAPAARHLPPPRPHPAPAR
jgi:hypothetical protein